MVKITYMTNGTILWNFQLEKFQSSWGFEPPDFCIATDYTTERVSDYLTAYGFYKLIE